MFVVYLCVAFTSLDCYLLGFVIFVGFLDTGK